MCYKESAQNMGAYKYEHFRHIWSGGEVGKGG